MTADEFEALAQIRWDAGIRSIRGGDRDAPFKGDPIVEAQEECLDLFNYTLEAWRQKRLHGTQSRALCAIAHKVFEMLEAAEPVPTPNPEGG